MVTGLSASPSWSAGGFLRIVTNRAIYYFPSTIQEATNFIEALRVRPNCVIVSPGPRHWQVFVGLCLELQVSGRSVPDAYFAAIAIESGDEWVTADRGYRHFPGLRWRHPFRAPGV
jgi:toxin-antitoxin system PIN domain toxin